MKSMKHNLGDILKTFASGFIALISAQELETLLNVFVAVLIAVYWSIKISLMLKKKKELKKEE